MTLRNSIKELGRKKVIALIILAALDVFIIALPYYFKQIIPNFYSSLHISEGTYFQCAAIIGWVTLVTQLPGGWLADRFSSKKLLLIGTAITGLMAAWYAGLIMFGNRLETDSPVLQYQYYVIFFMWGISTTPFFWTPLWKLVSEQGDRDQQGLAYSLQGGFNGVIGFLFTGILGLVVVSLISSDAYKGTNASDYIFGGYILFFAVFIFVLFFALMFLVSETKIDKTFKKETTSFKTLLRILSDWKIWALAILLLGMYSFQSTFSYTLNQLMVNTIGSKLGVPTFAFLLLVAFRVYVLRITVGGILSKYSDRFKSFILLLIFVTAVALIATIIFALLPGFNNAFLKWGQVPLIIVFVIMNLLFILIISASWVMVTLRYTQQTEIYRPKNTYGMITAIFSLIGFSSDAWFSQISTPILANYKVTVTQAHIDSGLYTYFKVGDSATDPKAYQILIAVGAVVALIGLIAGLLVYISNYKFNKKYGLAYSRWRGVNNA